MRYAQGTAQGWKWELQPLSKGMQGIIHQTVTGYIESETPGDEQEPSDRQEIQITEAWDRSAEKADYFLIPSAWRERSRGRLYARAIVWSSPTREPGLERRKTSDLGGFGTLAGATSCVLPPRNTPTTTRTVLIEWDNTESGASPRDVQSGRDLRLVHDTWIFGKKQREFEKGAF